DLDRAGERRFRVNRLFYIVAEHGLFVLLSRFILTKHQELIFPELAADEADDTSRQNNEWKGNPEKEDRYECERSESPHHFVFEGFGANADHGLRDDRHDGGLHPEKDRCNPRDLTVSSIDPTQSPEEKGRGQNKKSSRNNAAPDLVQQPTDVDRKLVGLRPRQQHAKIQSMEESRLTDPFLLLYEFSVQQCNLSRRSTETYKTELKPEPACLRETRVPNRNMICCRSRVHRYLRNPYHPPNRSLSSPIPAVLNLSILGLTSSSLPI